MKLATAAQMRECDRIVIEDLGLPGVALMESAGRAATLHLRRTLQPGQPVRIFCGGGNNGGDGFVIARELLNHGHRVEVVAMAASQKYRGDALINLRALEKWLTLSTTDGQILWWGDQISQGQPIESLLNALAPCDALVDALLGTGLTRAVRAPYKQVIEHINQSGAAMVYAVDIPSGLSSDTGQAMGVAVQAHATATFGLAKVGQLVQPGRALCAKLEVIDIGLPPETFDKAGINAVALVPSNAHAMLPQRPTTGHKGTFGHVLALGGAKGKTGALTLCAHAALRSGAGLVTAAGSQDVVQQLATAVPEIMTAQVFDANQSTDEALETFETLLERKVVAAGPGLGTSPRARALLGKLLERAKRPMVLDADALNILADDPHTPAHQRLSRVSVPMVLTPHPGEFGRLTQQPTGSILEGAIEQSRRLARLSGAIVVCKLASTIVAHPDGRLAINTTGNHGMGTGGSGDVLTGIIAGLLAQGSEPWEAACAGVFYHGLAGDLAVTDRDPRSLTAGDLIQNLGRALLRR